MTPDLQNTLTRAVKNSLLMDAGYDLPPAEARFTGGFRGRNLLDVGRECAQLEMGREITFGEYDSFSLATNAQTFKRALNEFLAEAVKREFRALGDTATCWLRPRRIEKFTDTSYSLRHSALSTLGKIGNGGAIQNSTITENYETRTAETYGLAILLPRQAMIGSDVARFHQLPGELALTCRQSLDDLVFDLLAENSGYGPTMSDGQPLFSAAHSEANLLTGSTSALSKSSLTSAMSKLRNIKDAAGRRLKLRPRYLIVPASLETAALQVRNEVGLGAMALTTDTADRSSPSAVRHAGPLDILVLPALDDLSTSGWYLSCSENVQALEMCSLGSERPEPSIEPMMRTEVLAIGWRLILDAGIAATDWRTCVKSDGV